MDLVLDLDDQEEKEGHDDDEEEDRIFCFTFLDLTSFFFFFLIFLEGAFFSSKTSTDGDLSFFILAPTPADEIFSP